MIEENTTKDSEIMRVSNSKQFNQREFLNGSNGLCLSPFYMAIHGTDRIISRQEGP